jgi:hypothetical protein
MEAFTVNTPPRGPCFLIKWAMHKEQGKDLEWRNVDVQEIHDRPSVGMKVSSRG